MSNYGGCVSLKNAESGSSGEDLSVLSVNPLDGAHLAALTGAISARFSEIIDSDTISSTSFLVYNDYCGYIDGLVTSFGDTVTFTPLSALSFITGYTATLTSDIKDINGNSLPIDYNWIFTTKDKWGIAEEISDSNGNSPRLAMDASGNAIAVWSQVTNTKHSSFANRYISGTGWAGPELLENNDEMSFYGQDIAMNDAGHAIVIWKSDNDNALGVFVNRYIPGVGWSGPETVKSEGVDLIELNSVAMGPDGSAMAVWMQKDSTLFNLWSNIYISGTGWAEPELVENIDYSVNAPKLVMDVSGNAVALWRANSDIYANSYISGTGWGLAEIIDCAEGVAYVGNLAVDSVGNAIAVWYQDGDFERHVWGNHYISGTGWTGAFLLQSEGTDAIRPRVAMNQEGNAVAVWESNTHVYVNRYISGTGYAGPELVENSLVWSAYMPEVAMNNDGHIVVVWQQGNNVTHGDIWSNRYIPGMGWFGTTPIGFGSFESVCEPRIALDSFGNAIVVWSSLGLSIWSNRFEAAMTE